jgi:hypothetical protein
MRGGSLGDGTLVVHGIVLVSYRWLLHFVRSFGSWFGVLGVGLRFGDLLCAMAQLPGHTCHTQVPGDAELLFSFVMLRYVTNWMN